MMSATRSPDVASFGPRISSFESVGVRFAETKTTFIGEWVSIGGCGWYVKLQHDGGISTLYCHMVRKAVVQPGQKVKAGQVIGYDKEDTAPIEAIYYVGKAASRLALYIENDKPADSLILAESVFSLGVKLCEERIRWREFEAGAELVRDGAYLIHKLDSARAQAASVDGGMKQILQDRCSPRWTVIGSIDQDVIGRTAGDVFYIAKNSPERLWRIEALLKLGRYKFNAGNYGRSGDQRWSKITVRRMANDASLDPVLRTAAKAANDLTLPQFNMIGG